MSWFKVACAQGWRLARNETTVSEIVLDFAKGKVDTLRNVLPRLPDDVWNEHAMIVAGTGGGKSNIFELMLTKWLPRALKGECSVVVVDGSVFPERVTRYLKHELKALHSSRVVLIDPAPQDDGSLDHLPAMNLFDVPAAMQGKMGADYMIGTYVDVCAVLIKQELTPLMETLFANAVQLMFCFERPTLRTLRDILEAPQDYVPQAKGLDDDVRRFFEPAGEPKWKYEATRKDVISRIEALLARPVIRRLLCAERPTLNLFDVIDGGAIVVMATRQADLADDGTRVLGRFVINILHRIAQARAKNIGHGAQTFVMIDEMPDYLVGGNDPSLRKMHKQNRKYGMSITTAFQDLGDLNKQLGQTMSTCTTIKLAGSMDSVAAAHFAKQIGAEEQDIVKLKPGQFLCKVKGLHENAIKITIPPGSLGRYRNPKQKTVMAKQGRAATAELRQIMAARFNQVLTVTSEAPKRMDEVARRQRRVAAI